MTRPKVLGVFVVAMTLASLTASARSSARGTRTFALDHTMCLKTTSLPAGKYQMKWESHSPEATVTFVSNKNGEVAATAQAKLVQGDTRYDRDSLVYDRRSDGSRLITEIRIGGTTSALVFE